MTGTRTAAIGPSIGSIPGRWPVPLDRPSSPAPANWSSSAGARRMSETEIPSRRSPAFRRLTRSVNEFDVRPSGGVTELCSLSSRGFADCGNGTGNRTGVHNTIWFMPTGNPYRPGRRHLRSARTRGRGGRWCSRQRGRGPGGCRGRAGLRQVLDGNELTALLVQSLDDPGEGNRGRLLRRGAIEVELD